MNQSFFATIEESEAASLSGGGLQYSIVFPPLFPYPVAFATYSRGSVSLQAEAVLIPFNGVTVGVAYSTPARSGKFSFVVPSPLLRL